MPYIVEATTIEVDGTTTYDLHLLIRSGHRFTSDHDRLRATTMAETPKHAQLNDLLVRDASKRNRGRGSALLEGFEELCRRRGITWVEGGISSVDDMERLDKFYRRRGYSVIKSVPAAPFAWTLLKELSP